MASMVKDKVGVVKYWVRAHEVTCNYTEYEHDVEYDRYYSTGLGKAESTRNTARQYASELLKKNT